MDKVLAMVIDRFKIANPRLFAIVAFALTVIHFTLQNGADFGVFKIEGTMAQVAQGAAWLVALLLGGRTTNILKGDEINALKTDLHFAETRRDFFTRKSEKLEDRVAALESELAQFNTVPEIVDAPIDTPEALLNDEEDTPPVIVPKPKKRRAKRIGE